MGRPTQHNHPSPWPVRPGEGSKRYASAMRYPNPTPARPGLARDQARHAWRRPQRQGHARTSFPNPEAKTASADGTAPARVWESRTPPPAHHKGGGPPRAPPFRAHTTQTHRTRHTATPAAHANTDHPHTGQSSPHRTGHTATHTGHTDRPHTRQSSPHPVRSLSTGSGPALRARDRVERGRACVGLLTASRALSALSAAEPLVSQSLEGLLSGCGSGSVVRVSARV